MPGSLYSVLLPLVEKNETGLLKIKHESGKQGALDIENGNVTGAECCNLIGVNAAKKLAMWVHFSAYFTAQVVEMRDRAIGVGTQQFLSFLKKVSNQIDRIKKIIPSSSAIIQLFPERMIGKKKFDPLELEIATLLDGKRTISEIVASANQPELHILSHIFNFHAKGMIEVVTDKNLMPENQRIAFMDGLRDTLADILGPAAEIVIQDAFERTGLNSQNLSKNDVMGLIDMIATHLDTEDKSRFNSWAIKKLIRPK